MWRGKLMCFALALLTSSLHAAAPNPIWIEGGHTKRVVELKVDSLSSNLVSACADGSIKVWSLSTGKLLKTLYGNSNAIRLMDFALNGDCVAAITDPGELILWNVATGRIENRWSGFSQVRCLSLSLDATRIITGSGDTNDTTITIWSAPDGELEKTLVGHSGVITSLSFSYDGETLYSTSLDSTIREWDLLTGELKKTVVRPVPVVHGVSVFTRFILPQEITLARYSLPDWDPMNAIPSNVPNVQKLVFSRKSHVLAAANGDGRLGIGYFETDVGTESEVVLVDYPRRSIPAVVPTTENRYVYGGLKGKVIEKEYNFPEYIRHFGHLTSSVEVVQFNAAATRVLLGAAGELHLFRSANGEHLGIFPHSNVTGAAFSPNGLLVASSDADKKVRLWRASDQSLVRTLSFHTDSVNSVAFSPNGIHFASGSADKTIRIWNTNSATALRTITGTSAIKRLAYSSDGGTILAGDSAGSIRFWRASDGQLTNTIPAHQSAIIDFSLSPDGNLLATCSATEPEVKVWRLRDGSFIASIATDRYVASCVFSPDSTAIAASLRDLEREWSTGEVRVWRIQDRALLHLLTNELQRVGRIAWASNGVLAAGRIDAVALLFSLPPPAPNVPRLSASFLKDTTRLRLNVTADPDTNLRLQGTTNFVEWQEWTNITATGTEELFDFPIPATQQFFRAISN